jgi:hypothetical protein
LFEVIKKKIISRCIFPFAATFEVQIDAIVFFLSLLDQKAE